MDELNKEIAKFMLNRLNEFYQNAMVIADLTPEQITNVNSYVAAQQLRDIVYLAED